MWHVCVVIMYMVSDEMSMSRSMSMSVPTQGLEDLLPYPLPYPFLSHPIRAENAKTKPNESDVDR